MLKLILKMNPSPKISPKMSFKMSPETSPKMSPKMNPKMSPEMSPKMSPKSACESSLHASQVCMRVPANTLTAKEGRGYIRVTMRLPERTNQSERVVAQAH